MSRGIESMPAVLLRGSTVNKIKVSVQNGQDSTSGSPPRRPTNRILRRLAPSQLGYVMSSEWKNSGVDVAVGLARLSAKTGVSSAWTVGPVHSPGGRPGRDVSCQQIVNDWTNEYSPKASTIAIPQKIICRNGKRYKLILSVINRYPWKGIG